MRKTPISDPGSPILPRKTAEDGALSVSKSESATRIAVIATVLMDCHRCYICECISLVMVVGVDRSADIGHEGQINRSI